MFSLENFFQSKNLSSCIVAEIGINHNGDISIAKESIIAASEAGVQSVKFQNYHTEDFITDRNLTLNYKVHDEDIVESQYDLFKRCELTFEELAELKELCDSLGILFHSTPTSLKGIQELQLLGCEFLKNGSDYLCNHRLIKFMGESGLTTIISTGMATISEIDSAVKVFRQTGNENLILLHCTSSYPTPPEHVNLARIQTLRDAFDVEVGFSDHTDGIVAAVGARLKGARWIEKHFTLDKNLVGPDHWFSLDPQEMKNLVHSVRDAEKMIGKKVISPAPCESYGKKYFRLSCVAARDLPSGVQIQSSDINFQRPGDGIEPMFEELIVGLDLKSSLKKGQQFNMKHFNSQND